MKCYLKTDLAWAAGFIDGEGSFFIGRTSQGPYRYFRVQLKVTQTNEEPLRKLQKMFGGYIYEEKAHSSLTKRQGWRWMIVDHSARRAVSLILPYLMVKRGQAKLLIEMGQRKARQGKRHISAIEFEERNALAEKMEKLNSGVAI